MELVYVNVAYPPVRGQMLILHSVRIHDVRPTRLHTFAPPLLPGSSRYYCRTLIPVSYIILPQFASTYLLLAAFFRAS